MHKNIRKKTFAFIHKHRLTVIDFKSVRSAAKAEGYTLVEFNHLCNDKDVNVLAEALHLQEYVRTAKGFTYADNNYRIIFLHEDLSDTEKSLVLLHELGHIVLGHLSSNNIIGNDVVQEYEANEFSHYVANRSKLDRFCHSVRWHKKWYVTGISAVLLCVLLICCFCRPPKEELTTDIYTDSPVQTEKMPDTPETSEAQPEKQPEKQSEQQPESQPANQAEVQEEPAPQAPETIHNAPYADTEVYVTETGKKYHKKDCRYIKNKTGVKPLTPEQLASGFFKPCAYCNP